MKKSITLLSLSVLLLNGCSGKDADPIPSSNDVNTEINTSAPQPSDVTASIPIAFSTANTQILFNPITNTVSPPYFTFFAGTTDGTASFTIDEANPRNPVFEAINDIDGWSTNAPINIHFKGSLSSTSPCSTYTAAITSSCVPNIFLIPLNVADTTSNGMPLTADPLNPATIDVANPVNTTLYAATQIRANSVTLETGNDSLRISPIRPLANKTLYLLVITDGLEDASSQPVGPSPFYQILTDTSAALYNGLGYPSALQGLRAALLGAEAIATGVIQASLPSFTQSNIVYTHLFTTTAPQSSLIGLAHPAEVNPAFSAVGNTYTPTATTGFYSNTDLSQFFTGTAKAAVFDAAVRLVQGAIELPSYLPKPTASSTLSAQGEAIQTGVWRPTTALAGAPTDVDTFTTTRNGTRVETSTNITYRFPFPAKQADILAPITVITPAGAKPTNGWPVVILTHGITQERSSLLGLASKLADACNTSGLTQTPDCFASVMIDLPLHGHHANALHPILDIALPSNTSTDRSSLPTALQNPMERHFGITYNAAGSTPATRYLVNGANTAAGEAPSSGSLFINLLNFQNTRDHLKQAVADHLTVLASLGSMDVDGISENGADFDTDKVFLVGHSIGGMIGLTTAAAANSGSRSDLPRIQATALLNAGGQLTRLLENSPDPNFGAAPILAGLAQAGLTQNTKNFDNFFNVFQATLDHADPINFAQLLSTTNTPAYFAIMAGDGTANSDDQVVPVDADNSPTPSFGNAIAAPLAGSEPLVRLAGAVDLSAGDYTDGDNTVFNGATATDPKRVVVRFSAGTHGTGAFPATPLEAAVFNDMVNHISTFFTLNGQGLEVTNASSAVK